MPSPEPHPNRADYGIDAPPIVRNLLLISAAGFVTAAILYGVDQPAPAHIPLAGIALVTGILCLLMTGGMIWSSKVGKIRGRDRLLSLLPWRGDEMVLDVGCGRGLLLIGAARRLTTGKAIGVDIWQSEDLSGNRPEATLENAQIEGVAERVEVKTADARQLPFPDASFDVVVSNIALHNIYKAAERQQAVREIARVLKPGGRVAIMDIQYTAEYARVLRESGLIEVQRSASWALTILIVLFTWGGLRPFRLTGRKPDVSPR
jgi:SAM-dependent methyltransferase